MSEKKGLKIKMNKPLNVFAQNSIYIKGSYTIYVDPFHIPNETHDADFIFITHPHWDHFSLIDILKVRKDSTNYIIVKEIFEELLDIGIPENQIKVVKPLETHHFEQMSFKTIAAYNITSNHHPKEKNWVGYLIEMDQVIYYIAGDTDVTKEIQQIKADVIFLPVGGTYTMDYRAAARLANTIGPHLAIPTHYLTVVGSLKDAKNFRECLKKEIACQIFYRRKEEEE